MLQGLFYLLGLGAIAVEKLDNSWENEKRRQEALAKGLLTYKDVKFKDRLVNDFKFAKANDQVIYFRMSSKSPLRLIHAKTHLELLDISYIRMMEAMKNGTYDPKKIY